MPNRQKLNLILPAVFMLCQLLLMYSAMPAAFSQEPTAEADQEEMYDYDRQYEIGPADVLLIKVYGLEEMYGQFHVSNSGKVHIPYLGILSVNGLTTSELQKEIARMLVEKDLLKDPWVEVKLEDKRSHSVYLLGEVMQPGQFALRSNYRVSDLIFQGVGFNDVRNRYGYLYRRSCDPTKQGEKTQECTLTKAIKIDFNELLEGNRPELNLELQPGDILHVPERQLELFYVVGDVIKAGSYSIPFDTEVRASQAVAWAGGPLKTAKMSKGRLLRYSETGEREELPVDFAAIIDGKMPDFFIHPNDIIFIPGSRAKTLGYGIMNILPGIAISPIY